jgi:hypothetical protein
MPIFGLIPRVSGDRQELRRAVGPLLWVFYLSFIQIAAMVAVTILFFEREELASAFYDRFNWFTGHIPFLWRYGDYFTQVNRLDEFKLIFSIYCGYFFWSVCFF